jgi:hypothetical protein
MVNKHMIPREEIRHARTDFDYLSRRFMTEHQRRFFLHVPTHNIAGADATGSGLDKRFSGTDTRNRFLFKTNIGSVV